MTKDKTPHDRAEEVHDERAEAATSDAERQKIRDSKVEPLLNEPGRKTKEWD